MESVALVALIISVWLMIVYVVIQHRKITKLENRVQSHRNTMELWMDSANYQQSRAETFKAQCIKQSAEIDGLREAVERATIHQPPPTLGE